MEFQSFPKIERYANTVVYLTEKIDGTNAMIGFTPEGELFCQSRRRMITPEDDNYGFAAWATLNRHELFQFFGPGRHFGEWYGNGIQRNYGMLSKCFAPFNTKRFPYASFINADVAWPSQVRPLPVLGNPTPLARLPHVVAEWEHALKTLGSMAVGDNGQFVLFDNPEGIMLFSPQFGYLKHPFDPAPKLQSVAWDFDGADVVSRSVARQEFWDMLTK